LCIAYNVWCGTFATKIKVNELDKKIRVGAVSYLNTKPLLYGIQQRGIANETELVIDYPSSIATMLLDGRIDLGLVPVAIIPDLKDYYIITNYCIGSNGAVASVCLFSEVPINKIHKVLLDYQSKTSVQLAKILLKEYWKINPEFVLTSKDYRKEIGGNTAALIIGDRALEQRRVSAFVYDLGEAWKKFTGLPFVYAAWISNKKLDKDFVKKFDEANKYGIECIGTFLNTVKYDAFDLNKYYTENISYIFDDEKRKGLNLFLNLMKPK
jgi:chorismate dehydratase